MKKYQKYEKHYHNTKIRKLWVGGRKKSGRGPQLYRLQTPYNQE